MTSTELVHYIALDVGEKRVGYATADSETKFPVPRGWFDVDGTEIDKIVTLVHDEHIRYVAVGYPRNLDGDPTAQTEVAQRFGDQLTQRGLAVYYQDESLTSVKAEEYLRREKKHFEKGDVDAYAAAIILADFLESRW